MNCRFLFGSDLCSSGRQTDRLLRVGPVLSRSWEIENRVDLEEDCN